MNLTAVVNVAVMAAIAACAAWPSAVRANSIMNRYGKQQLAQKQNRYGNAAAWLNGAGNRVASGWASPYAIGSGNLMRHYPVSMGRYQAMGGGGVVNSRGNVFADDYYDGNVSPYDPRLQYDRSVADYAVVRYPSYGAAAGYYPLADLAAYETAAGDDLLYDNMAYGGRDSIVPSAAAASSAPSSYYQPSTAINRYDPPQSPLSLSLNRYEPTRYPTDKIHKFRKVFMSNLVSPSNAFKSTKEQQLYDFWESLINGRLDGMQQTDGDDDGDGETRQRPQQQHQYSGRLHQQQQQSPVESDAISQLYQHLPPIFQQLQQQQKLKQLQHQQPAGERASSMLSSSLSSSLSSLSSSTSSTSSSHPGSSLSHAMPSGNHYKQWANGSPLIKRGVAARAYDDDDVRQLEELKARNATAVPDVTTAAPPMADGGQREYVLPRPAGEKSGFESLLEVIAEGGLQGHLDKNTAVAYDKIRKEAKVNKKRSFVSDETSLAAQLGALRKN